MNKININLKRLLSYFISIFLSIFIIFSFLLIIFKVTVLNKNEVKRIIQKENYYESIKEIIDSGFIDYSMQSGFDNTIFDGVITEEQIKYDVNNLIDYIYGDKNNYEIDTSNIKEKLELNINNFVKDNNYFVSEEVNKNIEKFKDNVIEIYKNNIVYSNTVINKLSIIVPRLEKIFTIGIILSLVGTIMFYMLTFSLKKSSVGISILVAGVMLIIARVYSGINIVVNSLLILNKPLTEIIKNVFKIILNWVYGMGIILMVLGLVIIVFKNLKKK